MTVTPLYLCDHCERPVFAGPSSTYLDGVDFNDPNRRTCTANPRSGGHACYRWKRNPKAWAASGILHVPAGWTYTQQYEVAAWRTEWEARPGSYLIWRRRDGERSNSYGYDPAQAHLDIHFVCTYGYTPSLYGGVPVGSVPQGKNHRDVGTTETKRMRLSTVESGLARFKADA